MKPISEVYPDQNDFFSVYSYQPMLDSFGYEIVLQVDDSDYQGDSRVLFRRGDSVGYLNFGWGSCSGCDALQACGTLSEVDELRTQLHDSIRWFDSISDAAIWFNTHDWEGEYGWHQEEQREFIEKAKSLLSEMTLVDG